MRKVFCIAAVLVMSTEAFAQQAPGTTVARVSSIGTTNFVVTGSALASSNYYFLCV